MTLREPEGSPAPDERAAVDRALRPLAGLSIGDFDFAFAWEAIARAARVAGDHPETEAASARTRELAAAIGEEEDRELLLGDLATI